MDIDVKGRKAVVTGSKPDEYPPAAWPLFALAVGTFAIGTSEFMPMGLLPVIAREIGVLIPSAGLLVSAYAIGVLAGVPLMTLALGDSRRCSALLVLMGLFTFCNVISALAPGYGVLLGRGDHGANQRA